MLVRVQPEGQSCRNLRGTSNQHMRSVLSLAITNNTIAFQGGHHSAVSSSITTATDCDSFFKDGRKIRLGDCALFKPPQDSPPFIGLIRWLTVKKDNTLLLGVNWLYRPAEIKPGKGTPVEGAPNEIFYSFHKDEIPAASLLHPCKVAFLPRGVGLPAGTSSFVCRRVYDIANKCLWWLTDQDYINERQEEVDQLLHKTKIEMHATLQPGGRSPKQVNGPTSTSQLKPASDNQNTGTLHSHAKGKKRERGDHGAESVKRERNLRSDNSGSFQCTTYSSLKSEVARITEKGGLMDLEGVERLVQLMQPDSAEKKMDLVSRSLLAGVMAATDKVDCLNRFVQLRGLPVLDEWLQDVHRGKIGDGNSPKDSEKVVEEFILVSLRALDRLPVNLQALQMCNIGKSVNHLRSHKNVEIQRKARSLVDTWKKRVEAEMISIDAKSASTQGVSVWPSKSRLPDASQSGSRTPSGYDVGTKSSVTQNSVSKTTSARSSHGESNMKSVTASPGHVKTMSSPSSCKESQPRISGGAPDIPLIREDRSSSSNQSHSYTQSSGKEDGKSSIGVPATVNKISGVSTRNRKNSGFSATTVTGNQKEISSSRSSTTPKSTTSDKLAQSSLSNEKVAEGPIIEGSNHKLIVKISNRIRSPVQGAVGGSLEDSTYISSRVSSPAVADKHEQFEHTPEHKSDAHRSNVGSDMNVDSWQNDEPGDALTESADGAASPAALPDEEQSMSTEDSRKSFDGPQTNQLKSGKMHDSSFSPMNALIESCVKYSEANTSLPIEDDVGMKLLASVATGEMSRSDLVSPSHSTEQSAPAVHEFCLGDEAKSKPSPENVAGVQIQFSSNDVETGDNKRVDLDGGSRSEDGSHLSKEQPVEVSGDTKSTQLHTSEDVHAEGDCNHSAGTDVRGKAEPKPEINEKTGATSTTLPIPAEKVGDGELNEGIQDGEGTSGSTCSKDIGNCKSAGVDVIATEEKSSNPVTTDEGKPIVGDVASEQSSQSKHINNANERLDGGGSQQNLTSAILKLEPTENVNSEKLMQTACTQNSGNVKAPNENSDMEVDRNAPDEIHDTSKLCSVGIEPKKLHEEANHGNKEIREHISASARVYHGSTEHEALQKSESKGPKSTNNRTDEQRESASPCADASSSVAMSLDTDAKVKFDLNEGFSADEGKYGEPTKLISSDATAVHVINSLAFYVNSMASSQISNVTVAAAAKGPFLPPEVLRSKGELGWKGSAATSAFRPAEPRKALEMPLGSTITSSADASTSKHSRVLLDIDLNVPDERVLEEMASRDSFNKAPDSMSVRYSGGLDLDLNRVDEASENGNCSTSSNHKGESSSMHVKTFGGMPPRDTRRDFDLNDGPGVDDNVEPFAINQQIKSGILPQLSPLGLRMHGPGQGNISSWFPPGNSFSTMAIPSVLADRGDHPFPVFPPNAPHRTFIPSGVTTFTPDIYRGSVLSSSPAVPFQSSPFQLPVLPFGTTFPLPSATFPSSYMESSSGPRLFAPPMHLGPTPIGPVASQFQRSYMVNLQDNGGNNGKWGKQGGLDLNAGPASAVEAEAREMFPLQSSQHSVSSSQALAEEQARMYSVMKRKEPDSGWENDGNFRFEQSSWQ